MLRFQGKAHNRCVITSPRAFGHQNIGATGGRIATRARRKAFVMAACGVRLTLAIAQPAAAALETESIMSRRRRIYDPLFLAMDKGYFAEEGIAARGWCRRSGGVATPALFSRRSRFSSSGSGRDQAHSQRRKAQGAVRHQRHPGLRALGAVRDQEHRRSERSAGRHHPRRYQRDRAALSLDREGQAPAGFIAYTPAWPRRATRVAAIASGTFSAVAARPQRDGRFEGRAAIRAAASSRRSHQRRSHGVQRPRHQRRDDRPESRSGAPRAARLGQRAWRHLQASRTDAIAEALVAHGASDAKKAAATYDETVALLSHTGTAERWAVCWPSNCSLRADLLSIPRGSGEAAGRHLRFPLRQRRRRPALVAEHWKPKGGKVDKRMARGGRSFSVSRLCFGQTVLGGAAISNDKVDLLCRADGDLWRSAGQASIGAISPEEGIDMGPCMASGRRRGDARADRRRCAVQRLAGGGDQRHPQRREAQSPLHHHRSRRLSALDARRHQDDRGSQRPAGWDHHRHQRDRGALPRAPQPAAGIMCPTRRSAPARRCVSLQITSGGYAASLIDNRRSRCSSRISAVSPSCICLPTCIRNVE